MDYSKFVCRSCQATGVEPILSFGHTPLADALLTHEQLSKPELTRAARPGLLPGLFAGADYGNSAPGDFVLPRLSVFLVGLEKPAGAFCRERRTHSRDPRLRRGESLVVEAASNDGYMLQNFVERGIPVLGIDPAEGPVRKAQERGVNSVCTFFTRELAERLKSEGRQADVFLANNVLAHVADLNGFVDGFRTLLKPDGLAVIEAPYLVDLIEKCEFDTIYHQHLCYFSVTALDRLLQSWPVPERCEADENPWRVPASVH